MYNIAYNVDTDKFLDEAADVLLEHWDELALNKEHVKLAPDRKKYKQLQELGIINNIVIYDGKTVVGYSVLIVQPNLHYSENVFAHVDIIYVSKEYRQSSIGARLLLATEQLAKDLKASVITHHAKPYVPMIIKPLEKLGYSLYEHIYGKYLGV
jgi:GNAT superfamily N-acetyltransferase